MRYHLRLKYSGNICVTGIGIKEISFPIRCVGAFRMIPTENISPHIISRLVFVCERQCKVETEWVYCELGIAYLA